jgi:hypothetical protein
MAKKYAGGLCRASRRQRFSFSYNLLGVCSLALLSAAFTPGNLASTPVPNFDLNEVTQYQDSLSPDDYASLLERARQLQAELHANAPRTIDASEYKQAIQTLKADTKDKVEARHNELDQATKQVNEEIDRINRTYESYSHDLNDEQKDGLDHDMQDLLQRWKSSAPAQKGVNQNLNECAVILEQLHKINERIIASSMTRVPLEKVSEKDIVPFSDEMEKDNSWNELKKLRQRMPFFDYRYSPMLKPAKIQLSAECRIANLLKRIEVLRGIKALGTFEYETFKQNLDKLAGDCKMLKPGNQSYSKKNEQILMEKIAEAEHEIQKASGN